MDISQGETAESHLDALITKRHDQRVKEEGERPAEEMYAESVRRQHERQEREIRAQWYGWHCAQAERHRRTLEALIAHHELEAEKLCEENGNGHKKGEA